MYKQANPRHKQLFKILYKPNRYFNFSRDAQVYKGLQKATEEVAEKIPNSIRYTDLSKSISERTKNIPRDVLKEVIKSRKLTDSEIRGKYSWLDFDWDTAEWPVSGTDIIDARSSLYSAPETRASQVKNLLTGFDKKLETVTGRQGGYMQPGVDTELDPYLLKGILSGDTYHGRKANPIVPSVTVYNAKNQFVTGADYSDPRMITYINDSLKNNPVQPNTTIPIPDKSLYKDRPLGVAFREDYNSYDGNTLPVHTPGLPHEHRGAKYMLENPGYSVPENKFYESIFKGMGAKDSPVTAEGLYLAESDDVLKEMARQGFEAKPITFRELQGDDQGRLFHGAFRSLRKPIIENLYNAKEAPEARNLIEELLSYHPSPGGIRSEAADYRWVSPFAGRVLEYGGFPHDYDAKFIKVPVSVYNAIVKQTPNNAPKMEAIRDAVRQAKETLAKNQLPASMWRQL